MDTKPITHSKINITTIVIMLLSIASYAGFEIEEKTKSDILFVSVEVYGSVVLILRTFFSGSKLEGLLKTPE